MFTRLRRALTPRDPLYRRESGGGRRAALVWKLLGLLVVLSAYAMWFWRLWTIHAKWKSFGWKIGSLAAFEIIVGFLLFGAAAFILGFRSVRNEVSGDTAEALVLTSASRLRLVWVKLLGSVEFLAIAALLVPLYCLTGINGGGDGEVEAFLQGGVLRLLAIDACGDYGQHFAGDSIIGLCAFASDLSWYALFAACGVWTAVSRKPWPVIWLKGLVAILLTALVVSVAARGGMAISSASTSAGDEDASVAVMWLRLLAAVPTGSNPAWLALLVLGATIALRLLMAHFLLLRAARRFDVIALDPDRPTRRFKPGFWRKAALVGCGAVVLLAAAGCLWLRHIDREHERLLAEARARLLALNFEPPPEEENAAPLYENTFGLFANSPKDFGRKFYSRLKDFTLEIGSDEIAAFLNAETKALSAAEQAATKPQCVFVSDYSAGVHTRLPSLYNARSTCILLSIAAKRAAHDGDYPAAVQRIGQMLHLARGIGQPRFIINHMIMCAIEEIACTTIRDILTETDPDEASLRQLLATIGEHLRLAPTYRDTLRVEQAVGSYYAAQVAASGHAELSRQCDKFVYSVRRSTEMVLRDARTHESLATQVDEVLALPRAQAYRRLELLARSPGFKRQVESLGHPYTVIVFSVLSTARNANACQTQLNCARLAIACRLYQMNTGKLPERLSELAGYFPADFAEVMTDPFSGRQLLYKRTDSGFIVYSVGDSDARDNGAPDPYVNSYDPDLCFPVDLKLWEEYRVKRTRPPQQPKGPRPAAPPRQRS